MPWTGDVIATINDFLRNRYDMSGVSALRVYRNPVLERVRKVASKEDLFAYATGKGHTLTIQTSAPMNTAGRGETEDWPKPGKTTFKQLTVREIQYAASTGITQEEQDEATRSEAGVATLLDIKLRDLRDALRFRLQCGVRGDGTGRLARVASFAGGSAGGVLTLQNTAANFGWDGASMMIPDMVVDVYGISGTTWTKRLTGYYVTAINTSVPTAHTVTIAPGPDGSFTGNPASGDVVFLSGSALPVDSSLDPTTGWRELNGLLYLVDDGSSSFASGGGGSFRGVTYLGVNRTAYPTLMSRVIKLWDNNQPVSWDLETLMQPIRDIDSGFADGRVTALYCHPDMAAAIARKAAAAHNATTLVTDGKVTGGYYTRELNVEGRMIPIIPMPQGWPKHTILGVDEEQLRLYLPQDITFVNPYTGKTGTSQVFFGSPGARNLTFEAWLRFVGQLVMLRCDSSFRLEGLRVDE